MKRLALALILVFVSSIANRAQTGTTIFEGARVIVGDGRVIENAAIVVNGGKITQVGPAANMKAPAGATRVSLTGKTVMPTIVDTHVHTSQTREALTQDLQRRAYYGVSAAMSMGQDTEAAAFELKASPIPGAARIFTAGRGMTAPEPGRTMAPYWISTAAEGRKAVQEQAARKVDIIKIWVDDRDGKFMKLTPELYGAIIDEAHKNKLRVTAHLFTLEDS
jgi:imidazolonepropionase-like amidohydrolase